MPTTIPTPVARSPWSPFRQRSFAVIWTATVISNIGGWLYSAAAAWLMTSLTTDPLMVSLVQVATSLPMFLFALPAGALADIIDKRRFLIVAELAGTVVSAVFAALVMLELVGPVSLLLFMFIIGATGALTASPWQSVVPSLVPREDLSAAIAANSVGVNISRAVGPALSGMITAAFGIAAPFWLNAFSNLGAIGALVWWKGPKRTTTHLPAERFASAMRMGVRHAWNNPPLRATLVRTVAFFTFASAYWALLPLLAKTQITGGAEAYGFLLGAIGVGALAGAAGLPFLKARFNPDQLVVGGTIGTATTLALFGTAHHLAVALLASVVAGASWIATLSSLNVSVQVALPEWVRARGLAVYVTVFFGAMTLGSVLWGWVASVLGLPMTHFLAAAGALLAIPLTASWKLQAAALDLKPSMHWPVPTVSEAQDERTGAVMVTVEYRIAAKDRAEFLAALDQVALERRRDGAYAWGLFEDVAEPNRFVETFFVESWLEHLRQHERVTDADRVWEERVLRLLLQPAKVTHHIAVDAAEKLPTESEADPAKGN